MSLKITTYFSTIYILIFLVDEDTCKQSKKQCVELGGFCREGKRGIECICPFGTVYVIQYGCQGR